MKTTTVVTALALGLATAAGATTITLRETMRSDVSAFAGPTSQWFIGRNLASVAWNGTDAFIGGQSFDTSGSAIAKFRPNAVDQTAAALLSGNFGFLTQAATRGVQDLALGPNGELAVAWDNGAASNNGFRQFDSNGAAMGAATFGSRGNGAHYDPTDGRLTGIALGSGRVYKFNSDTSTYNDGVKNWNATTGPLIFPNPANTSTNRDLTMDLSGNIYWRGQNSVLRANRSVDGLSYGTPTLLKANGIDNVNGQNIEFVNSPTNPDFLIYGDRLSVANGQSLASVVKAMDLNGGAITLDFQFRADYGDPAAGNGYYDFSYHAGTRSLAMSDFANNKVYFFEVVPAPGAVALLGLGALMAGRRRR